MNAKLSVLQRRCVSGIERLRGKLGFWQPGLLLVTVLLAAWSTDGLAKDRLHLLTVQGNVAGADVDVSVIEGMIGRTWGNTVTQHVQQDGRADKDKIFAAVDKLKPDPDDILFFYYSGHGATADGRHFLQLDSREAFFRDELRTLLTSKGARLTILVTDCCAVRVRVAEPSVGAAASDELRKNLQRLFQHNGVADITSAYTGQFAWGEPTGGVFTGALAEVLWKPCQDWQHFFAMLQVETQRNFHSYRQRALSRDSNMRPQDQALVRGQTRQTPQHFGLPGGLEIEQVFPFTTATKLKNARGQPVRPEPGDRLLAIDNQYLGDSDDFARMIQGMPRNAPFEAVIVDKRSGQPLKLSGKLDQGGDYRLGLLVEDGLPEQDDGGFRGLPITRVYQGTAATKTTLPSGERMRAEPGDRLFYINDRLMLSSDEFVKVIGEIPRGGEFTMTIIDQRTGNYLDLVGRLDQGGGWRLGMYVDDPE